MFEIPELGTNAFYLMVIAVCLGLVGLFAWMAEQKRLEKYRRKLAYSLFAILAAFNYALYSINDNSEFEFSNWYTSSNKDGGQKGNRGGGNGGRNNPGGELGGDGRGAAGRYDPDDEPGSEGHSFGGATEAEHAAIGNDIEEVEVSAAGLAVEPFKDCNVCPEMVQVPAGVGLLGAPLKIFAGAATSGPPARVTIRRSFAIGRYEIKRGEFDTFVKTTGYAPSASCNIGGHEQPGNFHNAGFKQDRNAPAVCVNWLDAQAYVAWLTEKSGFNYRLPSEVEWEYAARAGTAAPFQWEDKITFKLANFNDVSGPRAGGTMAVGTFPLNAFGMADVHGNAWELVQSCWSREYAAAGIRASDAAATDCGRRMMKGGGWRSSADQLRFAMRSLVRSDFASDTVGFRVVRDGPAPKTH